MFDKGFKYFVGKLTNTGDLQISFSTLPNGRGEEVEIVFKDTDCEVVFYNTPTNKTFFNQTEEEIIGLINKNCWNVV